MDAGALTFELWLEEEEEHLQLGQMLLSACPAEFLCPISLDIMAEPVILVSAARLAHAVCCSMHGTL